MNKAVTINDKVKLPYNFEGEPKDTHVELFKRLAATENSKVPMKHALLILCTPRCGSTLFSEALNSCGKLGICEEWFNYEYFAAWSKVTGCEFNLNDYVTWVVRKSTRNTGTWCLKWHIGQLVSMNKDFNLGLEAMDFQHVVYLYRRDKIAQSVSLMKAITSNQFRCYEKATGEAEITRQGISSGLESIIRYDMFTKKYLMKYIDATYAYEDFRNHRRDVSATGVVKHPHSSYNAVLRAMGVEEDYDFPVTRLKKQSDGSNVEARNDFRQYILGEVE